MGDFGGFLGVKWRFFGLIMVFSSVISEKRSLEITSKPAKWRFWEILAVFGGEMAVFEF